MRTVRQEVSKAGDEAGCARACAHAVSPTAAVYCRTVHAAWAIAANLRQEIGERSPPASPTRAPPRTCPNTRKSSISGEASGIPLVTVSPKVLVVLPSW